jgi:hypothetical protein
MTLDQIMAAGITPALAWLPPKMTSPEALVQLLATGLQESRFEHRYQVLNDPSQKGPARSFWQMERNGGVVGVMTHPASKSYAFDACAWRGVPFEKLAVWQAIENDDVLAAVWARLLYWTTPGALPRVTQTDAAWALYVSTWRPGKPKPDTWPANHKAARAFLGFP